MLLPLLISKFVFPLPTLALFLAILAITKTGNFAFARIGADVGIAVDAYADSDADDDANAGSDIKLT